ncbi:MAG: carbon-nitrogen hydrolase family protein [Firmicutes bacterium]|nr:carbon-nitrogen hydrolase family protein [Bacillota bacterium]
MSRFLNLGIIQSTGNPDIEENLKRIEKNVDDLMTRTMKPELICGVELGIGSLWMKDQCYDTIPGRATEKLSEIARKHGIYLIPGSMTEIVKDQEGNTKYYNSIPIFNPSGEIIDVYRKMCPYYPGEEAITKGEKFVVFEIPEKSIKVGVINCHDWCFPEVSRIVTLMGAELILRPAVDPEGLYDVCKSISPTRAFENQAYFASINMVGRYNHLDAYGHSNVYAPDAALLYEAGDKECLATVTLDMDIVENARRYGTRYTEQLLRQYRYFNIKNPYADNLDEAPLYANLPKPDLTLKDQKEDLNKMGIMIIGKQV